MIFSFPESLFVTLSYIWKAWIVSVFWRTILICSVLEYLFLIKTWTVWNTLIFNIETFWWFGKCSDLIKIGNLVLLLHSHILIVWLWMHLYQLKDPICICIFQVALWSSAWTDRSDFVLMLLFLRGFMLDYLETRWLYNTSSNSVWYL